MMDEAGFVQGQLDLEFDQVLAGMKPYVVQLHDKSDRQRSAMWIKKLCENHGAGNSGRRTRNQYAQSMLAQLKEGHLQFPFSNSPDPGPLKSLSPHTIMSVPDWVTDIGGSADDRAFERARTRSRSRTPPSRKSRSRFDESVEDLLAHPPSRGMDASVDDSFLHRRPQSSLDRTVELIDWSKPIPTVDESALKGYRDDGNSLRLHEKEADMKVKLLEAKFYEEKLRLQQKHDSDIQRVLDRKNEEIEEVKLHYRGKLKEQDDVLASQSKKIEGLVREVGQTKESRDRQLAEHRRQTDDRLKEKQRQLDAKLQEVAAQMEEEKCELQKTHTRNIQELLDETNGRLTTMESEYRQQMNATQEVITELETRVQALTDEAASISRHKSALEAEKSQLLGQLERLTQDADQLHARCAAVEAEKASMTSELESRLRSVQSRSDTEIERLKQEYEISTTKLTESVTALEQQNTHLRRDLDETETIKQRELRQIESDYAADKMKYESAADKKLRLVNQEMDAKEEKLQKTIRRLEQQLDDKQTEVNRLTEALHQQRQQAEMAFDDFKKQTERQSARLFEETRRQMARVEADLERSRSLREQQQAELGAQLDNERATHAQQLQEARTKWEEERAELVHQAQIDRDHALDRHKTDMQSVEARYHSERLQLEARHRERRDRDAKAATELESQIRRLQDELQQAKASRKQQLTELGLLREEEKQRTKRDHEHQISELKSHLEQEKLEMQRHHSQELDDALDKTNNKLTELEREYAQRSQKQSEIIGELQESLTSQRESTARARVDADNRLEQALQRLDDDRKQLKRQHAAVLLSSQQENESLRARLRLSDKKIVQIEHDLHDEMTQLKLEHEENTRGLMPESVRQELEDTIDSLKAQVSSLQQRAALLEEELQQKALRR